MSKPWYKHIAVIVLLHLAGWLLIFFIPYFIRPNIPGITNPPLFAFLNRDIVIQQLLLMAVFYFNAYWLIPALLSKKKYWSYVFAVAAILATGFSGQLIKRKFLPPGSGQAVNVVYGVMEGRPAPVRHFAVRTHSPIFPSLFLLVFVLAVSIAYRFFLDKLRDEKLQQQRETEHLKSELGFLRSQISPHFIFNVLNTAVSLARTQPSQVEPTLIKLSGLMRYMLYDTDDTRVLLSQELEYLEGYVALQQLRFGERVPIEFSKKGVFWGHSIEPMLLIPFIENAFKHGLGKVDKPFIEIKLHENQGILNLSVRNRYNPGQQEHPDKYSGIGLANARKRLDILYGNKYQLNVFRTDNSYETQLKMPLQ